MRSRVTGIAHATITRHMVHRLTDSTRDALVEHLTYLRLRGYTQASIYARERALIRLAAALGGDLLSATDDDLVTWRTHLTVSDDAIVHYVSHARGFYTWCVERGLLATNPAERIPTPRVGRRLPRPISETDLAHALAAASDRVRPWLVLAAWCGLRAKEIALLTRDHVLDTAAPPVLLVAADATKGRRERVVPLCPFVLAELRAASLPRSGWVFARHDGRPGPNAPHLVSQLANRHLHACGIDATLHQLRHRFGTQTYRASRDLRMVQELLGHASPTTTAGYAAYDRADAVRVVDTLPVPGRLAPVRRWTVDG